MLKDAYICTTDQSNDQQSKNSHSFQATKEALILQCLQAVTRYAWRYRDRLRHLEVCDLIGEAMLAITEHVDEGANKNNPAGWLNSVGKYAMIEYVATQDTLIPHHHGCAHHTMSSLDTPCKVDEPALSETLSYDLILDQSTRDYTTLYSAINRLSPARRQVIAQRFGLLGYAETPLQEMAPMRRDQQRVSKALAGAKQTLAAYLQQGKAAVA
jgi:RNA polymerase sigma factor (sigma-70 family)